MICDMRWCQVRPPWATGVCVVMVEAAGGWHWVVPWYLLHLQSTPYCTTATAHCAATTRYLHSFTIAKTIHQLLKIEF